MEMSRDNDQKRKESPCKEIPRGNDQRTKNSPYMQMSRDNDQKRKILPIWKLHVTRTKKDAYVSNEMQL